MIEIRFESRKDDWVYKIEPESLKGRYRLEDLIVNGKVTVIK
jgi:hypothetical protein